MAKDYIIKHSRTRSDFIGEIKNNFSCRKKDDFTNMEMSISTCVKLIEERDLRNVQNKCKLCFLPIHETGNHEHIRKETGELQVFSGQ